MWSSLNIMKHAVSKIWNYELEQNLKKKTYAIKTVNILINLFSKIKNVFKSERASDTIIFDTKLQGCKYI